MQRGCPRTEEQLYVQLGWKIAGQWYTVDYLYTASGAGGPPPATPRITAPVEGSELAGRHRYL